MSNGTCVKCLPIIQSRTSPQARKRHNRTYYEKNRGLYAEFCRKWREENPERTLELRRQHYRDNRERYYFASRARKIGVKKALPLWANRAAIAAIYRQARAISKTSGIQHDVDHIYPLRGATMCGLHVEYNLRVLPASENRSKHNNERWVRRDVNAARNILIGSGHGALVEGAPTMGTCQAFSLRFDAQRPRKGFGGGRPSAR